MSDHFKEEIEGHSSSVDAFFALRDNWSTVGRQVETAIDVFLGSYHTGQRTVRFLFGDFVEWVFASALYSLGFLALPAGPNQNDYDLQAQGVFDKAKFIWSIKASAADGKGQIRLKNWLGEGNSENFILEPTLIVNPRLGGVTLIEPRIHSEIYDQLKYTKDAVVLPFSALEAHIESHPDFFIEANLPFNKEIDSVVPGLDQLRGVIASDHIHYPDLRKLLDDCRPSAGGSVVEEIQEINQMIEEGKLSQEQGQKAIEKVINS